MYTIIFIHKQNGVSSAHSFSVGFGGGSSEGGGVFGSAAKLSKLSTSLGPGTMRVLANPAALLGVFTVTLLATTVGVVSVTDMVELSAEDSASWAVL